MLLCVFAEYVPVAFGTSEPETVRACVSAVRITSTTLVFSAALYLMETYYMIQDKSIIPVISSCLRNLILVLVLAVPFGLSVGINGIWAGFAAAQVLTMIFCSGLLWANYGRKSFTLYLDEIYPIQDYEFRLSPENILSVRESASEFLRANWISDITVNQAMILIEDTGMLILERNPSRKNIFAEYTIELHEDGRVRITIRDDGAIFDITDENLHVTSLRSYVVSRRVTIWSFRRNITTTSFNRNIFAVKEGSTEKLIVTVEFRQAK